MFSLTDKVAIVTGGRRGLGRGIALAFSQAGADVAVCDVVVEGGELEAVAKEIQKLGRRSLAVKIDVTKKVEVDSMVNRVKAELGPVDILVNAAGVSSEPTLLNTTEDEWHRVIDIDLTGCYLCAQAVAKGMVERRRGNIISIASGAGIRGFAEMNTYNIAKAGVIMLTKVLARDLGKHNVRVNAIAPTIARTEMGRHWFEDPEAEAKEAARIPLRRLAEVEDITGPALFLASDASSYVTGHTLVVDGGQLA